MIGSVRGNLLARDLDGEVVIEAAGTGVGYRVLMGSASAASLGNPGDEVHVWTHHHVREDVQVLYGFVDAEGRRCFEALIATHGVGPALALAILSVHDPDALAQVVADDDVDALCLVPGVGKKTAARLLIELKSKLEAFAGADAPSSSATASRSGWAGDLHAALEALGYRSDEIAEALRIGTVRDASDTTEALRAALQYLGTRR